MKKLLFPGSFCVGNDILKDFAKLASCYGKKFVFIGDEISLSVSRDQLADSFKGTDCEGAFVLSGKLCCTSEIARLEALPEIQNAEVICAVGGGGCMDISRSIAFKREMPLVMIPTTASSDAPCSFVTLTYSDDGSRILSDYFHYKGPDMVMVDSNVIANAPARLLSAGMGDALATWYEGFQNLMNPKVGPGVSRTAMALASLCRDIIMTEGLMAYDSVLAHAVTPQLEDVIEANVFLSNVGGMNSGNACGHGLGDWLASIPGGHGFLHGERVFIGLIVQLILEKRPYDELIQIMKFGRTVGLPVCIGDMHVEDVKAIADKAGMELQDDHFMANLTCDYTPNILSGAIMYAQFLADHLGEK